MGFDWKKAAGTGIDLFSTGITAGVIPAASYALTGQSLGANIMGDSYAPELGDHPNQKKKSAASDLEAYMQELADSQQSKADEIYAELEAQGRPEMDAQVQRNQEIVDIARQMADTGMPEAQRQQAQQQIERSGANAMAAASSRGAGMQMLAGIQGNQNQAFGNLAAQDAMMANQNQQGYMSALGNLGAAEGMAEQYNQLLPYEQQLAYAQGLEGSAIQNQMGVYNQAYMNSAANQQQLMDMAGMVLNGGGTVASIASDIRLKENISHTGYSKNGIPIYQWRYKGDNPKTYSGTMAQDLLELGYEDAVVTMESGFFAVDYSKIDVDFKTISNG